MTKKRLMALVLLVVLAATTCVFALSGCDNGDAISGYEMQTTVFDSSEISLTAFASTASESNSVTITATVAPTSATDKTVEWTLAWVNPSGSFANGKDVSNYVQMSASGNVATVTCIEPFGDQIVLTVSSAAYPEVTASCVFDYAKRITGANYTVYEYSTEDDFIAGESSASYSISDSQDIYYIDAHLPVYMATAPEAFSYTIGVNEKLLGVGSLDDSFEVTIEYAINPTFFADYVDYIVEKAGFDRSACVFNQQDYFYGSPLIFIASGAAENSAGDTLAIWYLKNYNAYLTDMEEFINSYSGQNIWTVTITYTGTYSTFTDTIGIRFNPVSIPVTGISVSSEAVVF